MVYSPRILLVDEEEVMRRATAMLLSRRGADVSAVASLDEAMELAEDRHFDVAIFDLSRSDPPAHHVLDRLRFSRAHPRRLILCCSEEPRRIEAAAFSGVLRKPYAFDRLMDAVFGVGASPRRRARGPTVQHALRLPPRRRRSPPVGP